VEGLKSSASTVALAVHRDGDVAVLTLSGELDFSNVDNVRTDLQTAMTDKPARLVFELSQLDFIDSSGLAFLLEAARAAPAVEVRAPSPAVRRLLELTGLSRVLPVVEDTKPLARTSRSFASVPDSVHAVRSFIRSHKDILPIPLLADLELVASELATNAVQFAQTAFEVRLELRGAEVLLEVTDSGTGVPTMGPEPSALAPHGRGLRIVDAIADGWGVRAAQPGPGKTVWVRLAR
jgi:anti-anti-sigma factor